MSKPNKEVTVKEADVKAQKAKSKEACKEGLYEECLKLYRKETHSIQQLLAYARQLDQLGHLVSAKKDDKKK